MTALTFIQELDTAMKTGTLTPEHGWEVSYDGDHKSAEIIICKDGKQLTIRSSDVEDDQD